MLGNNREPNARSSLSAMNAPDLPPRIDRGQKPNGITPPSTLLTTASRKFINKWWFTDDFYFVRPKRNQMNQTSPKIEYKSISNVNRKNIIILNQIIFYLGFCMSKSLADTAPTYEDEYSTRINTSVDKRNSTAINSLERTQMTPLDKSLRNSTPNTPNGKTNGSAYDSVSSYDSCNTAMQNLRLGPNAPDDLKLPSVRYVREDEIHNETFLESIQFNC